MLRLQIRYQGSRWKQDIQDSKAVLVKAVRQAPMPHMPSVLVRQGYFTSVTEKTEAENFASSLIAKAKPLPGSHTTRIAGGRTSRSTSRNSKTDRKGKHIQVMSSSRRNPRLCGCLWLPYFEYMLRSLYIPRAG